MPLLSAILFVYPAKVEFVTKRGIVRARWQGIFVDMKDGVRNAELEEDHHTRLRYLSWSEKVDDKWVRQTVVLHAGETHPILEDKTSVVERSRLA
jgi:hypothetical protein